MGFGNPGDRLVVLVPYMIMLGIMIPLVAGLMTEQQQTSSYTTDDNNYITPSSSNVDLSKQDAGLSIDDMSESTTGGTSFISNLLTIAVFDFNMNIQNPTIGTVWLYLRALFIWLPSLLFLYSLFQSVPIF